MPTTLTIEALKTRVFTQGEDLFQFLLEQIPSKHWQEDTVLAITSKIVSLAENHTVPKNSIDKKELIKKTADYYLGEFDYGMNLTIHLGLLMPAAGIDESNSQNGDYILLPPQPYLSAELLYKKIISHFGFKNFGLIFTDSRSGILRQGTTGVTLAHYGFLGSVSKAGELDLFGRELKITKINYADSLAAAAVLMMGEGNESCPLAIIKNAPVTFSSTSASDEVFMDPSQDMYRKLYESLLN